MKRIETRLSITGFLFCIGFALFPLSTFGQSGTDTSNMIRYTPEYKFKEGIFLNFQQVRENDPIPKSRILTNVDFSDRDFFLKCLRVKYFFSMIILA